MKNKKTEKLNIFKGEDKDHFKVTIFGSARIKKDSLVYKKVEKLAEKLAENEIDIITGGGEGLMEAGNEGQKTGSKKTNNKTHSIGIGIKLPFEQKFNKFIDHKKKFKVFSKRLDQFMVLSNAIVVCPGGLGTLLELFYTWQLAQVNHICHIPIILFGDEWVGLLDWIKKEPLAKKYLDEQDYELVFYAKNEKEVLDIVKEAQKQFKAGGKNFCLNYKKYKLN